METFNPNTVEPKTPVDENITEEKKLEQQFSKPLETEKPQAMLKKPQADKEASKETNKEQAEEEEKAFGSYDKEQDIIKKKRYDLFQINTAVLLTFIFIALGVLFFTSTKVNIWSSKGVSENYAGISGAYKNILQKIDRSTGLFGIETTKNLGITITEATITNILTSDIPYIFKIEIMQDFVQSLTNQVLGKIRKLEEINAYITDYGFIHPEIMSLFEKQKDQVPLISSLHTIETVKFSTSFNIFSLLETFTSQVSQYLREDKNEIVNIMQDYAEKGEADIASYLAMCYLNPYENLPECDQIGDFDNYVHYDKHDEGNSTETFKQLFALIDDKLENSTIPNLQIDFSNFNPNNKNLEFNVTINTLREDERYFAINPHVYIASTLVSLLRQSLFVIGDSINIQEINIREQVMDIGGIQVPIKSSSLNFNLPLQTEAEREIFDYYHE